MERAAEVRVRAADGSERHLRLRPRTLIGRAEDCDIYFPDHLLSRHHAEIELRPEGCFLIDLDSTNGTFLNGRRVQGEERLAPGDRITAGNAALVFEELPPLEDPPPSSQGARLTRKIIDVPELVRDDRVLGALSRVTNALMAHASQPDLHGRILDLVLELIPAARGALLLCEGDPPVARVKASRGEAPGQPSSSIVRRATDGRVALLFHDVPEDPSLRERPSVVAGAIQAAMCAPLWLPRDPGDGAGAGRVLGALYLDSPAQDPFEETDLHLLTVLANFAATKLESARLAEENLERRRLEQDVRLAGEIQARLLPQSPPHLPGWDVAGSTRPSFVVGGDYYDFAADPERLHFALGDVSGHGVGAAMLMVDLRATVRAYWREERLGAAIGRVNQRFLESVPWDKYATLFLGRAELGTGRLVYVNAGHNRPLLVRAGGAVEWLGEGGTVLGAFADSAWAEGASALGPGDTLVVFSDGVSETWPDPEVADRALVELTRARSAEGAAALEAAVFAELERCRGDRPQDDRTLMVIRRR